MYKNKIHRRKNKKDVKKRFQIISGKSGKGKSYFTFNIEPTLIKTNVKNSQAIVNQGD